MKLHFTVLILLSTIALFSQNVKNSSFESWYFGGFLQIPIGWSTSNEFTAHEGIYSVSPDTISYDSNYSVKIETVNIGFGNLPYAGYIVNGSLFPIGNNDFQKIIYAGEAFPYCPSKLTGYYKYTSSSTIEDWGHAYVILKKYDVDSAKIDTIGIGSNILLNPSESFKYFEIYIDYLQKDMVPDSVVVAFYSTYPNSPTEGGKLWIDDIQFEFSSNISEQDDIELIHLYPNPANNICYITSQSKKIKSIEIVNAIGQSSGMYMVNDSLFQLDISMMKSGVYYVRIRLDNDETLVRKIIKTGY